MITPDTSSATVALNYRRKVDVEEETSQNAASSPEDNSRHTVASPGATTLVKEKIIRD